MTGLIGRIEGALNKAVGKAKQRADDRSLHEGGIAQERKGDAQQDGRQLPAIPDGNE